MTTIANPSKLLGASRRRSPVCRLRWPGRAPRLRRRRPISASSPGAAKADAIGADGSFETQAGAHPFEAVAEFHFKERVDDGDEPHVARRAGP